MLAFAFLVFGALVVESSPPATNVDLFQSLANDIARSQSTEITPVTLNGVNLQSADLFDQLLDIPRLDKLCKTYAKEKHGNQGVNNLLQIVCKKRNQLLKQTSDCLTGMTDQLRPSCERVCIQRQEARVESLRDECGLGLCVARCVDTQMSECFAESGVQPTPGQAPVALYSEIVSSMVSTALNAKNEEEMMAKTSGMVDTCIEFLRTPVRALHTTQNTEGADRHDNQF